ncbi:hypothetical protein HUE56_00475 (plasmid) [Azospirillum oryzae]|uniref:Uncharacterized protein n=1 Tax=Azospirillum oryzae TaxID=286727 RepID=A0A6N1AL64_9PROT|nr:hypothetical protein [Azospirillum oryzae]KAA0586577.1 hypothetical protein FZ938_20465 [Azospirillum oryzae]QKS49022.1 hypothetical protein HUE56_00475 [Azospirillum oryzae]GLR82220.1 hypothetical protein GCM10007856_49140 [Azospirillum oryzae]
MSDIAIHQLPAANPLTGGEILPVDDGTATLRTTVAAIRQGLAATGHGHAVSDVAGLQTALDAKAPLSTPAFTGAVTVPAGSAAAPAVSPAGDGDTGLFFPAANTAALATAGIERLRIAPDGTLQLRPGGSSYLGIVPATPHLAGNVSSIGLVVADGGGASGVFVHNTHNGTYCSQEVRIATAQGGTSFATERARVGADGTLTFGGAPGTESLRVLPAAGSNRAVTVAGSSGGDPVIATTAGRLSFGAIPMLPSYTVATLPSAAARGLIYVSDGAGGKRLAVSDGTNWRWPDGAIAS